MILFNGFNYIGSKEGVCGGDAIIVGTRLKPEQVVSYGTKEEVMEDFDLTEEQIDECYIFTKNHLK